MTFVRVSFVFSLLLAVMASRPATAQVLDKQQQLDAQSFWDNRDWDWYAEQISFFECPDADITTTWYYRWELLTKHLTYGSPNSGYSGTPNMGVSLWGGSPLYEKEGLKEGRIPAVTPIDQVRDEGNCGEATSRGAAACECVREYRPDCRRSHSRQSCKAASAVGKTEQKPDTRPVRSGEWAKLHETRPKRMSKITRLPPKTFKFRKRPIGNSGAFFCSSLFL